jgi:RimJ/RimL family protein N-acetyltransferase
VVDVHGTRVRLRSLTLADVEPLVAGAERDRGNLGPRGDEARGRLRRQIERAPTLAGDGFVSLAVEVDGELVGDVQARAPKHAWPPGVCEIGISLFPEARGRGIGREAIEVFTAYLLDDGVERVQASTALGNAAMRRVLEHLGFGFEGVLRDFAPAPEGGREDYALYAYTRPDRR